MGWFSRSAIKSLTNNHSYFKMLHKASGLEHGPIYPVCIKGGNLFTS
jgi:hypothetical protein